MPIKGERKLVCERCGKKFTVVCNDGITIEDMKKLNTKLCLKCRISRKIIWK